MCAISRPAPPGALAITFILLLGLGLRVPGLGTDFWLDEIWALDNVTALGSSWRAIFTGIHHDSNHWLPSLWFYVTGPEAPVWVYRLPSLVAGVATIIVAGRLARRLGTGETLTMLLVAVSYPLGFYSTEARGYALAALAGLVSLLCVMRWLEGRERRWLLGFWLAAAVGILSHLSFVIVLAAIGAWLLALVARHDLTLRSAAGVLAVPAGVLVVLAVVDLRFLTLGGGPHTPGVTLLVQAASLAVGGPLVGWLAVVCAWVVAAGLSWELICRGLESRQGAGAVAPGPSTSLSWVFFVVLFGWPIVLLTLTDPPFLFPRYLLVSVAFVPLVLASLLGRLSRPARGVTLIVVLALNAWAWTGFASVGRGHYAEALTEILEAVPEGRLTVGGDHEFRQPTIVRFHRSRLGSVADRLAYVDAEFWIASAADAPCDQCVLIGAYPSSPLSGMAWWVYRRMGAAGSIGLVPQGR
jgi:hypothetical protein